MSTSHTTQIVPGVPRDWKELASRESNGLVTTLLWNAASGDVNVVVLDRIHEDEFEPLEPRLEVLRLLPSEMSFREIGTALFVSHNTVKTHARHASTAS